MNRTVSMVVLCCLLAGCASEQTSILDKELEFYRYEQERYRSQDLETLYEEEAARSEELTREILAVRKEIDAKEAELREVRTRLAEIERAVADAKMEIDSAPKPAPAGTPAAKPEKPPPK